MSTEIEKAMDDCQAYARNNVRALSVELLNFQNGIEARRPHMDQLYGLVYKVSDQIRIGPIVRDIIRDAAVTYCSELEGLPG